MGRVRRSNRTALCVALLGASACADDLVAPAVAELCGRDGPVKLLELDADTPVETVFVHRHTQRFSVGLWNDWQTELWTVNPCGDDPQLFEPPYALPWVFEQWPDRVFECTEDSIIIGHDVNRVKPPIEFEIGDLCVVLSPLFPLEVPGGFVLILHESGGPSPLVLQRFSEADPSGSVETIVLIDDVRTYAPPTDGEQIDVLALTPAGVFALTTDDQLVLVDLDTFAVVVVVEGVREFVVDESGRYLLWQSIEITNDDDWWLEGPIHLLDRATGESMPIDESSLDYTHAADELDFAPLGLAYYSHELYGDPSTYRWIELDTFAPVWLPIDGEPVRPIDDTRMLVTELDLVSTFRRYHVYDRATDQVDTIIEGTFARVRHEDHGITLLREHGGELIHVDYHGNTQTLARRAHADWQRTADGRVITPLTDTEDDEAGRLVLIDPTTLDERLIATGVLVSSVDLHEHDGETLISYAILDGPHRGVWLAKPAT